jgi:hypothetical protein
METPELTQVEEVTPRFGPTFTVDISDEACQRFGFKHGDRFVVKGLGRSGVVVGTAPLNLECRCGRGNGEEELWVRLDGETQVCFFPDPQVNFLLEN